METINAWGIAIEGVRRQGVCACADRALSFPQVVEVLSAQGKKVANRLKGLNSVVKSVKVELHLFATQFRPNAVATAVLFAARINHGCVNPILLVTRGRTVQNH